MQDNLIDILKKDMEVIKKGSKYVALCPFHDDKSPHFVINPVDETYYCSECGSEGDKVDYLMYIQLESNTSAIKHGELAWLREDRKRLKAELEKLLKMRWSKNNVQIIKSQLRSICHEQILDEGVNEISSPAIEAIIRMRDSGDLPWIGTYGELLEKLEIYKPDFCFLPETAKKLANQIKNNWDLLQKYNIYIEYGERSRNGFIIKIMNGEFNENITRGSRKG